MLRSRLKETPSSFLHANKEVQNMFVQMRSAGHVTAFVFTTALRTCKYIPFSLECEYVLAMHELESHIFNK
jgi:hypothetical protein